MNFRIPVLIREETEGKKLFHVRPLFGETPLCSNALLERALAKLRNELRVQLRELALEGRQDILSRYNLEAPYREKTFAFSFQFKDRTLKVKVLTIIFPGRELAMFPGLDHWFRLQQGELRSRCYEVLEELFRKKKEASSCLKSHDRLWTTELELQLSVPATPAKARPVSPFAFLGGEPVKEGRFELEKVGRCLEDAYPHDLSECLFREEELTRLDARISQEERRGSLLVGPRKVGKTALIHQLVRNSKERDKGKGGRRFWLLSPQRLISGMSFVGQWESRLLNILRWAEEKDLVLVFDELLGLFSAGVSRDSSLCVADLLKPFIQNSRVRVLAEISPESLAILKEKDRGFADLFALTHLSPMTEAQSLQIALSALRRAELQHECRFEADAITTAYDLQERYVTDAEFPGKLVAFLNRIGTRYRNQTIARPQVLEFFQSLSGVALNLLDDTQALSPRVLRADIQKSIVGQEPAVEALCRAVMIAKARLSDPARPIATLLFLGPTGVGKTECAKVLSRYLFGSEEKLLRFDMNEYLDSYSVTRLVGNFQQPDGLLTSAVRQRPFCVLLFDEVEKAHPDVFNLLLQVLGDGRLTDARGRTVDFTQSIVILSSNLGVKEAISQLGFRSRQDQESLSYRRAAEDFFSPEFFNRIDKVIPFERLGREETRVLAERLLKKIFSREGLLRRQCILDIEPEAMESIIDLGYHPELGARALKRALESQISVPVSARLCEMAPDAPTIISIGREEQSIKVAVKELLGAASIPLERAAWSRIDEFLKESLEKIECFDRSSQAPDGPISESATSEQILYYALQDKSRRAKAIALRMQAWRKSKRTDKKSQCTHGLLPLWEAPELLSSPKLSGRLGELRSRLASNSEEILWQSKLAELMSELSYLSSETKDQSTTIRFQYRSGDEEQARCLRAWMRKSLDLAEFEVAPENSTQGDCLSFSGPNAECLALSEQGYHLFISDDGAMSLIGIGLEGMGPSDVIVRVYSRSQGTLDLRSLWMAPSYPSDKELHILMALNTLARRTSSHD